MAWYFTHIMLTEGGDIGLLCAPTKFMMVYGAVAYTIRKMQSEERHELAQK